MKNYVLVGYMGSGKTTVGKNLARISNMIFLDTDEWIEQQQGRKISDIFAADGEEAFRDMETLVLREMLNQKKTGFVISTGGGMPVRKENRELLKELGMVFYLKAKPETIYERVKGDTKRPLLQCEDPLSRIRSMQEQRDPAYREAAHYIIEVDEYRQSEIAEQIKIKGREKGIR
ncbi:MAG: shikimate kinase [Lachnospiraceae bacterium]|nr:shikimate kinase [Lachnospiraceae bacterium]